MLCAEHPCIVTLAFSVWQPQHHTDYLQAASDLGTGAMHVKGSMHTPGAMGASSAAMSRLGGMGGMSASTLGQHTGLSASTADILARCRSGTLGSTAGLAAGRMVGDVSVTIAECWAVHC